MCDIKLIEKKDFLIHDMFVNLYFILIEKTNPWEEKKTENSYNFVMYRLIKK